MLSETSLKNSGGNISAGIEVDHSVKAVIDFIKSKFSSFAKRNKRHTALNEKGLNQKLCIFLNQNINAEPFFFQPEFMEDTASGNSAQVDIGTIRKQDGAIRTYERQYNEDDSFFSIEAKRLPTTGSNREKEYVIGKDSACGAMERFKKGVHGSRLKYAAIIGYVQRENFNHWFLKINSWIEELIQEKKDSWTKEDKVQMISSSDNEHFVELASTNSRKIQNKKAGKIQIFHFWVNLIEEETATSS